MIQLFGNHVVKLMTMRVQTMYRLNRSTTGSCGYRPITYYFLLKHVYIHNYRPMNYMTLLNLIRRNKSFKWIRMCTPCWEYFKLSWID